MEIEHFTHKLSRKYLTTFWVILPILMLTTPAQAHVKWFVETEDQFSDIYFQWDLINAALLLGAAIFLTVAFIASTKARKSHSIALALYKPLLPSALIPVLLRLSAATFLLGNIIQDNFVAPNFISTELTSIERLLQGSLLVLLVVNTRLFALGLVIFSLSLFIFHPLSNAIDYVPEIFALGIAIYFYPSNNKKITDSQVSLAVSAIRIGLGIQLIILTIHDKLIDPGLALNFLDGYPYINFMSFLFPNFSNLHFILAAGLAELCFGILLICNISSRFSTLSILIFFSLSGGILGPHELIGHIPIVILAVIVFSVPGSNSGAKVEGLSSPLFGNVFTSAITRMLRNQFAR